jgi:hypothetical protein
VLTAQLQAGNGLLVKDMSGRAIMVVRPPQQSIDSIGKLMHPAPATLYKIMRLPGTMNYSVAKSPNGDAVFHIEKVGWCDQSCVVPLDIQGCFAGASLALPHREGGGILTE